VKLAVLFPDFFGNKMKLADGLMILMGHTQRRIIQHNNVYSKVVFI